MTTNLFSDIPKPLPDELIEILVQKEKVRIERIVSRGHVSAHWYDQDQDEFVLVVRGEARLRFETGDRIITMKAGDYVIIPAHTRHRVEWTNPDTETIWLAVFY